MLLWHLRYVLLWHLSVVESLSQHAVVKGTRHTQVQRRLSFFCARVSFLLVIQCDKMGNFKSQTIADEMSAVLKKYCESLHRQHHLLSAKVRLQRRRHNDASVLLLMSF